MGDYPFAVQPLFPPTRKLVSVRQISQIDRVAGSPFFVIHVDGWRVVVPKRRPTYKVGDLVVYFEIDSFLPRSGPLSSRFWELFGQPNSLEWFRGKEGHRVRSRRICQELSQGIIHPLEEFPEIVEPFEARAKAVGRETAMRELFAKSFADLLGVEKWEFTETALTLPNLGRPPAFIRMPGWNRIQDVEQLMFGRKMKRKMWQVTEKLDGTTMTVYKIGKSSQWAASLPALPADCPATMHDFQNRYGVCSRSEDFIDRPDNLYWQQAKASGVLDKIRELPWPNIAIQGELCGSSIEGNTMQYPEGEHEFVVFAIWDIDQGRYFLPHKALELCEKHGIQHVPVVARCTFGSFARNLDEVLKKAEGKSKFGGVREGFVVRSLDGKDSFKVISNSWLSVTGK